MSVPQQSPFIQHAGNGIASSFAAPFKFVLNADLLVELYDIDTTLSDTQVLGVDYSVSGAGTDDGGMVTFTTPPASNQRVRIRRNMPYARVTRYSENGDLLTPTLEQDQDDPVLMLQQIALESARAFKVPVDETGLQLPPAASRANMFLAFDDGGEPIASTGTGADAGLRSDLTNSAPGLGASLVHDAAKSSELASATPGLGADLIGNVRSPFSFSRITQAGAYRSWPQDKWFVYNGVIYALFNGGSGHTSSDLSIYLSTSKDGTFWTDPMRIIGPAGVTAGVTAWGAGADSSGNFWLIARYRGADWLPAHTFHRLFKSTDLGVTWNAVLAPIGQVDSDSGEVPVLYHSFCEMPNGHLGFGYHFNNGRVGLIEFDPATYAYTESDIYTSVQMGGSAVLVEATLRRSGNTVFGFLRTQNAATAPVRMFKCTWTNGVGFGAFTKADTDITIPFSPVPILINGSTAYITYARRFEGVGTPGAVFLRSAPLADVLALNFAAFTPEKMISQLPGVPSGTGSSGAGVPSMVLLNNRLVIGVGFALSQSEEQADVGAVIYDLNPARVAAGAPPIVTREQISSSAPATRVLIDLLNVIMRGNIQINSDGTSKPVLRFDGSSAITINADGITLEIGSKNTLAGITEYRWYAGTSTAAFLALSNGTRGMQGLASTQKVECSADGSVLIRTAGTGQHFKALPTGQNQFATAEANTAITRTTHTPGFSTTIGDLIAEYLIKGAGTLATGGLTLPANPVNGQKVTIVSTVVVTAFTLSANTGQILSTPPSTIGAGPKEALRYRYETATTTWYPCS